MLMPTPSNETRFYRPRKFNATTRQRFFRIRMEELTLHCGRLSHAQMILAHRICRNEWDLFRIDAQMDAGEISEFAMRNRLAMENRLRLDLRDLGYEPTPAPKKSLGELLSSGGAAA